jgi:branched-chain amino acid transport system substrate-binding protein
MKVMAQAMSEIKGTDNAKLIAHLEKQAQFDILKGRKGYFRNWDHQLMQEAYPFTAKKKGEPKDKWDVMTLGPAVPAANQSLESIAPTREQNACTFKA